MGNLFVIYLFFNVNTFQKSLVWNRIVIYLRSKMHWNDHVYKSRDFIKKNIKLRKERQLE